MSDAAFTDSTTASLTHLQFATYRWTLDEYQVAKQFLGMVSNSDCDRPFALCAH
jgi:hypothetical protein